MGKKKILIVISILLSIFLSACGGGGEQITEPTATRAPQTLGTITWTGSKCTLDLNETQLHSGNISLELVNTTDGNIVFHLVRIGEGHTFEELVEHINQERQLAEEGEAALGLPTYAEEVSELLCLADVSITRVVSINPGTYAFVCSKDFEDVGERPFSLLGPIEVGE